MRFMSRESAKEVKVLNITIDDEVQFPKVEMLYVLEGTRIRELLLYSFTQKHQSLVNSLKNCEPHRLSVFSIPFF